MKCMHCLIEFHPTIYTITIGREGGKDSTWGVEACQCPSCMKMNLFLVDIESIISDVRIFFKNFPEDQILSRYPIWPKGGPQRPPPPIEVPKDMADDYKEACLVLSDSPKASAALSRRCLQNLLRSAASVRPGNLADEIQQVLDSEKLPSHIAKAIDGIRNLGNLAAHPMKSKQTDMILPVEPGEAEWLLDVLVSLFDFYYVQPTILAKKRAAINSKLKDAGKPPLK